MTVSWVACLPKNKSKTQQVKLLLGWLLLIWLLLGWLILTFSLSKNSLRRNWMLRQPLLFAYWLPKHLVHLFTPPPPSPPHTQTHSVISPMVTQPSLCFPPNPYTVIQAIYGYLTLTVLPTQPLHSQLGHLWLPNPHCASHPTLTQ